MKTRHKRAKKTTPEQEKAYQQLWWLYRVGSTHAMDELLSIIFPMAKRISERLAENPKYAGVESDDLCQTTVTLFLENNLRRWGPRFTSSLQIRVMQTAHYAARDAVDRRRREERRLREYGETLQPPTWTESIERRERLQSHIALIDRMLRALSPRDREIVLRRYIWNESLDAIGASLGISRERVRQREFLTINRLRSEYGSFIKRHRSWDDGLDAIRRHFDGEDL